MPFLDRDSFIRLLERLGDPDEHVALAAAQEIHERMVAAGITWDELLLPPLPTTRLDGLADLGLIDSILSRHDLADDTRRELLDFKADIAIGEFTPMDRKYLRGLHSRLLAKARH